MNELVQDSPQEGGQTWLGFAPTLAAARFMHLEGNCPGDFVGTTSDLPIRTTAIKQCPKIL